jgi:hypothetical protein
MVIYFRTFAHGTNGVPLESRENDDLYGDDTRTAWNRILRYIPADGTLRVFVPEGCRHVIIDHARPW